MPTRTLADLAGMAVLVVDDNPDNIVLLQSLLEQQGLQRISGETDARRVAARLAETRPDLVVLDLHMPHLDGFEVLAQVQRFAAGSYLPVLVLTADVTIAARNRALRLGAQDFLTKPLDTVETSLRIANLLRTRELYTTLRQTAASPTDRPQTPDGNLVQTRGRLETIIRDHSLSIVYQPIVDITTLQPVGHEALARFPDPAFGGPDRWFADAFTFGLGVELEWAAASAALRYFQDIPDPMFLAVNLSPATALHIARNDLCIPELCPRMVIELTEHVPVEDYTAIHGALAYMRSNGARLSADDLGSGYAGFRHLLRLQADIIKLDISIIAGIHENTEKRALTRALVTFSEAVGATIIAEGVEQAPELTVLQDLGVPWAQGYYLGRPAPLSPA